MAARWLFAGCLAVFTCSAVETQFWRQDEQSDFEKGRWQQLSLRSDGRLFLGPEFREVLDSGTPYLWAIAADSKGNLYTGGGGAGGDKAKLLVLNSTGNSRTLAEFQAIEIHAVVVDHHDRIYVATAPDGKVYRVGQDGRSEMFYDPHAKYIWALAVDSKDNLYVATGDHGEIHRVTSQGQGEVFFKTEETHARSLVVDHHDDLIVGTEPGGLLLRVSPAGEGFVLYQSPKREIPAVAVLPDGVIYAAGVGNRTTAPVVAPAASAPASLTGSATAAATSPGVTAPIAIAAPLSNPVTGGSELYRIDRDGEPRKIWSAREDIVYAIAFDSASRPLLGTGNKGRIYRVDSDQLSTLLVDAAPTQITNFCQTNKGALYAISGNIGKVFQIGPSLVKEGTFESEVLDSGSFSYWGRLSYRGTPRDLSVATRSGNLNRPQSNWSAWAPLVNEGPVSVCERCGAGRIASPAARFLQYKVTLAGGTNPELSSAEIAYLTKNVAPTIEAIDFGPPNYRYPAPAPSTMPATARVASSITLPPIGQHRTAPSSPESSISQTLLFQKGWLSIRWSAHDLNSDPLCFTVEIRGVNESAWRLLRGNITEEHFSFDTTAFPDGEYVVRLSASDSPANPPTQALTNSLVSEPFLIDNTPPTVLDFKGNKIGSRLEARWTARDSHSNIDRAEYSLNGSDWVIIPPVSRLSDSPQESYLLQVENAGSGEQVIAVRVTDEFGNEGTQKVVVR